MTLTKENICRLVALQESDTALDKLQKEMDRIPQEIAALRAGLEAVRTKLGDAKARTLVLEKKKKEREIELAGKEEAVRKHSLELNQVKTNEAFKALQAEIEQAKAAGSAIETEILEAMEGIDACRREEKAAAAGLRSMEDKARIEIAALEEALAGLRSRFDAQKAVRDQTAAGVPAEMLRIYNHARSRGKPDAVVPIDGHNCSACRIVLAPQMIIELTKAKSLVVCESCQRMLYRPEPAAKPA